MAGSLTLSTLSDGTNSTNATDVIRGSAKAWVKWTGAGGSTINASYNVSSVTRTGTGNFTITMTNALTDANYSIVGIAGVSSAYTNNPFINADTRLGTYTSSVFYISFNNGNYSAYADPAFGCVAVFR